MTDEAREWEQSWMAQSAARQEKESFNWFIVLYNQMSICSNILLGVTGILLLLLLLLLVIKTLYSELLKKTCLEHASVQSVMERTAKKNKKIPFIPLVHLNSTSVCLTFAQQQDVRDGTCDGNASPGCPQPNTCIYKRTHLSHKLFKAPCSRKTPQWKTDALNRHSNKGRAGAVASGVDTSLGFCARSQASMPLSGLYTVGNEPISPWTRRLQRTRRRRSGHFYLLR